MKHKLCSLLEAEEGYSDIQVGPDVERKESGTKENRIKLLIIYSGKF